MVLPNRAEASGGITGEGARTVVVADRVAGRIQGEAVRADLDQAVALRGIAVGDRLVGADLGLAVAVGVVGPPGGGMLAAEALLLDEAAEGIVAEAVHLGQGLAREELAERIVTVDPGVGRADELVVEAPGGVVEPAVGDPVAEALRERQAVGAISDAAQDRRRAPIHGGIDGVDAVEGVAAIRDRAPVRIGHAGKAVEGVVGVGGRIGDALDVSVCRVT